MNQLDAITGLIKPESLDLTIPALVYLLCLIVLYRIICKLTQANTERAKCGNANNQAITDKWMQFVLDLFDKEKKDDILDSDK